MLLLRVKRVRPPPRSYLDPRQPGREPPRRLLIPAEPSRAEPGRGEPLKTDEQLRCFQQIPTKSASSGGGGGGGEARVRCAAPKVCSVRAQTLGKGAAGGSSWERMRAGPAVLHLHWRRRSHRLAPAQSEHAEPGVLSPRLSLTDAARTHARTLIPFLLRLLSLGQLVALSSGGGEQTFTSADEELKSAPSG